MNDQDLRGLAAELRTPMSLCYRNDAEFAADLTAPQRAYFAYHVRRRERTLQRALRDLARGLSAVNRIHATRCKPSTIFPIPWRIDAMSGAEGGCLEDRALPAALAQTANPPTDAAVAAGHLRRWMRLRLGDKIHRPLREHRRRRGPDGADAACDRRPEVPVDQGCAPGGSGRDSAPDPDAVVLDRQHPLPDVGAGCGDAGRAVPRGRMRRFSRVCAWAGRGDVLRGTRTADRTSPPNRTVSPAAPWPWQSRCRR